MMLSASAISDVTVRLQPADFYQPAHEMIYAAIVAISGRGEPVDAVTVAAELDKRKQLRRIGGAPYLLTLIQLVPTAVNAESYATTVADKAFSRRLIEDGNRIVQLGYMGAEDNDVAEIANRVQDTLNRVTDTRTASRDDEVVDGAAFILGAPAVIPALWEVRPRQLRGGERVRGHRVATENWASNWSRSCM